MNKLHQVAAWDRAAEDYLDIMKTTDFTPKYCRSAILQGCGGKDVLDGLQTLKSRLGRNIKAIDIASGPGILTLELARVLKEHSLGSILGIDFSSKMIEKLNGEIERLQYENVEGKVMNGEALELEDNTFDMAFSVFGIILFSDSVKGLQETFRVLKPGGIVTIGAWTTDNAIMKTFSRATFELFGMGSGQPNRLPMCDEQDAEEKLKSVGFSSVKLQRVTHGWEFKDPEEFFEANRINPGLAGLKDQLGPEKWTQLEGRVAEIMKELYFKDDKYSLAATALICTATK